MAQNLSPRLPPRRLPVWLIAFALLAGSVQAQYNPDWSRHLRVGALAGFNIKANFKITGAFDVNLNQPDGVYDDGYAFPGQNPNYTADWGYDNASQYVSSPTPQILMHKTTAFSVDNVTANGEEKPFVGFDLAYGGNLWYWGRARIGYDFGFGLLPIEISGRQVVNGTAVRSIYAFNTGTILVPEAPYEGSSAGYGPSIQIPGTLLDNNSTNTATIDARETLDVILYTFRLGPSVYWDINRRLGVSVSAGPALGFVTGRLKWDETIESDSIAHNKGSISGSDVVYGGYVNASLTWHLVENGDLYLGAQFMPLGKATISGGGREGRLDLSGAVYLSAGINWPF